MMLAGPNGAGKSTLLEAVAGGVPYTGTIRWRQQDIRTLKGARLAREIGFLSQRNHMGYAYTVEEVSVKGYTSTVIGTAKRGFTVVNTHTPDEKPETTNLKVTKVWSDNNDQDKVRPKRITVKLLADGEVINTLELLESTGWEGEFTDLPTEKDGKSITYTVEEVAVEGYTASISGDVKNGFTIVNKRTTKTPKTPCNNVSSTIQLARKYGLEKNLLISSFSPDIVRECKEYAPDIKTGMLYDTNEKTYDEISKDPVAYCKALGCDAVHPMFQDVDENYIKEFHAAGMAVNPWTVDNPQDIVNLRDWGCDSVITNVPDIAASFLR